MEEEGDGSSSESEDPESEEDDLPPRWSILPRSGKIEPSRRAVEVRTTWHCWQDRSPHD